MWFESIVVIVDVGFWYKKSKDSKKWFLGLALWLKMQQDHRKRWFFFNSRLIFHEKIGVRFKFIFQSVWWLDDFAWLCFWCSWRGDWQWLGGQKGKIDIFSWCVQNDVVLSISKQRWFELNKNDGCYKDDVKH